MRTPVALGMLVSLVVWLPTALAAPGSSPPASPSVALLEVSHSLEGRQIIISGILRNTGPVPLRGLVIDADGYGPGGDLVASGTDGIPWPIQRGALERFSMFLPLGPRLVRDYVVQVTHPRQGGPLAVARRTIDVELYRRHVRSLVRLEGSTHSGELIVRADAGGLPVSQISVRASLWALDPLLEEFKLVTLDFDVGPDRSTTVFVSPIRAVLISLQIVDVRLRASWGD